MRSIEASEVRLGKILSSDYSFTIPDFQRPYAWEVEQVVQLLDDLTDALDRGSDEPYFLGSIVLVKREGEAESKVIDGQQRLTTLTILFAVLRALAPSADLRQELNVMIIEPGGLVAGLDPRPRLSLRPRDASFFRSHVQEPNGILELIKLKVDALKTDAQKNIFRNAEELYNQLSAWTDEHRLKLLQMLAQRTFLVVVTTPDRESAHRIFSVMNARGLDLSPADIFKSLVMGELGDGSSEEYSKKWDDAEQSLGREDFADLFLHLRMIFAKERAKRELLKEFPLQVLNKYLPDKPREFVDDVVVPYSEAYERIRDQNYSSAVGAEAVNQWFRRLVQLDNSDWLPSALWALRTHGDDPEWLNAFFGRLERLSSSLLVRRVYTTPRVNRYADLLRELDAGAGLEATSFELDATEKSETLERLQGRIYLVTKIRKYVLLRLDEVLANNSGATYAHKVITVEHVLPQNPKAVSEWTKAFTEDQRLEWTHRLANLVLLNRIKNSEASNYDFADKKTKYFTTKHGVVNFALTSQVLTQATWTPEGLEQRQGKLVSLLAKEWQLQ